MNPTGIRPNTSHVSEEAKTHPIEIPTGFRLGFFKDGARERQRFQWLSSRNLSSVQCISNIRAWTVLDTGTLDDERRKRPLANLLRDYQQDVQRRHPAHVETWPLLNGWDFLQGTYKDWTIVVVQDAGFSSMCKQTGIGELSQSTVGVATITEENREAVRRRLEKHFNIGKRDAIILFDPNDSCAPEFPAMLQRHEIALGLGNMKIFLSHKGVDKEMVRRFEGLLSELGFDTWLDDDAMPAGAQPDRAIQEGFRDSCAAVFFVTPDFKDETWLATDTRNGKYTYIEYARFADDNMRAQKSGKRETVSQLLLFASRKTAKRERCPIC